MFSRARQAEDQERSGAGELTHKLMKPQSARPTQEDADKQFTKFSRGDYCRATH